MTGRRIVAVVKSPRAIMSMVTFTVLAVIIYASRDELFQAWDLLWQANWLLLALLIPMQFIVYFAGGEMVFSYLRGKKLIGHISRFTQARIDMELNLVNHIFPSGGASGISYVTWRLHKLGVSTARSTFAQVVRYITGFAAYIALLTLSLVVLAVMGHLNRWVTLAGIGLIAFMSLLSWLIVYVFQSRARMHRAAQVVSRVVNTVVRAASFGKVRHMLKINRVEAFFLEMHDDFEELRREKKLLRWPFMWGMILASVDVMMYVVAFASLGITVDPAVLMIGYGAAGVAGLFAFTPGGAGVYEAVMIILLSLSGTPPPLAIAGIVLTRAILMAGTIIFGYIFYQLAILKYGKRS
ncbi:MAG: lysylphosphatidylglycerol synthase transmembrane domain-containing protein [Candidatus Saccharibacteria bacterium]|nr:lysylphosphatidylglycerol synthase transmembrane domain-containing protein [Candidatus Saccharibacteria bacterium]